jgi:hypothetical protein
MRMVRLLLFRDAKEKLWDAALKATRLSRGSIALRVTINRFSRADRASKPVIRQMMEQLHHADAIQAMRAASPSHRPWLIYLMGEGGQDAGGLFNEEMTDAIDDAMSPRSAAVPIFVPSANGRSGHGSDQDLVIPNPAASQPLHRALYAFLGKLIGVALRMRYTLSLSMVPSFWKLLAGEQLTLADLESEDAAFVARMRDLRALLRNRSPDAASAESALLEGLVFECGDGRGGTHELLPGGRTLAVARDNLEDYLRRCTEYRFNQGQWAAHWLLRGLSAVVPLAMLRMWSGEQLRELVCGAPGIDVQLLKRNTRYEGGLTASSAVIKMFWDVLSAATAEEQSQVLRFVWARTRLPRSDAGFVRPFKIMLLHRDRPDGSLPQSHTCMFQLDLPNYSSPDALRRNLLIAASNCVGYDLDGRASGVALDDIEEDSDVAE